MTQLQTLKDHEENAEENLDEKPKTFKAVKTQINDSRIKIFQEEFDQNPLLQSGETMKAILQELGDHRGYNLMPMPKNKKQNRKVKYMKRLLGEHKGLDKMEAHGILHSDNFTTDWMKIFAVSIMTILGLQQLDIPVINDFLNSTHLSIKTLLSSIIGCIAAFKKTNYETAPIHEAEKLDELIKETKKLCSAANATITYNPESKD